MIRALLLIGQERNLKRWHRGVFTLFKDFASILKRLIRGQFWWKCPMHLKNFPFLGTKPVPLVPKYVKKAFQFSDCMQWMNMNWTWFVLQSDLLDKRMVRKIQEKRWKRRRKKLAVAVVVVLNLLKRKLLLRSHRRSKPDFLNSLPKHGDRSEHVDICRKRYYISSLKNDFSSVFF